MLTPEAIDALTRLRAAIADKAQTHAWNKNHLTVSSAEVNPRDVVDLCNSLPDHPRTKSLQSGSANALDLAPEIRTVALHVVDIVHLIREAEKLESQAAQVPAPAPPMVQASVPAAVSVPPASVPPSAPVPNVSKAEEPAKKKDAVPVESSPSSKPLAAK
jgi:hypothetical protein